jgi:acetyl esterase/lipase
MTSTLRYDWELEQALSRYVGDTPGEMIPAGIKQFRLLHHPDRSDFLSASQVGCSDFLVTSSDGSEFSISVISSGEKSSPRPCIYFLHSGGMIMGNRFAGASLLTDWVRKYDVVGVLPEYRLAPDHPAPAQLEDSFSGLLWLHQNAGRLNVDPNQIIVLGVGAGGGLAAGVTLLARDQGGPLLMGQMLQSPMIDDRNDTVSAKQFDRIGVWDTTANRAAWRAVLGEKSNGGDIPYYWAPARAEDLSDLPPTYIDVGALEVFRDEAIAYAMGITQSGGQCELHVWGDAHHGFQYITPESAISKACIATKESWLQRLLANGRVQNDTVTMPMNGSSF